MRQPAEYYDDKEISLVHIATTLRGALKLERLLTDHGVDYAVETDKFTGGFLFRSSRTGAFFYVEASQATDCRRLLAEHGFKPHVE
jgi:hypothetical protein